jgi:hypothetical protein
MFRFLGPNVLRFRAVDLPFNPFYALLVFVAGVGLRLWLHKRGKR